MTSRILAGAFAVSVIAIVAAACDGTMNDDWRNGRRGDPCGQYTSCGACTPVDGCGWCTTGVGQGTCASDPNECASAPAFSWTWNASGCFEPADGGVEATPDAGSSVPPSGDAGSSSTVDAGGSLIDSARPTSDDAGSASDAADGSD